MSKQSSGQKGAEREGSSRKRATLSLRWIAMGFLAMGFLAQAFGFTGLVSPTTAQAISTSSSVDGGASAADPLDPPDPHDKNAQSGQNSKSGGVPFSQQAQAQFDKLKQELLNGQSKSAIPPTLPSGLSASLAMTKTSDAPNSASKLNPRVTFANTYYANYLTDDAGGAASSICTNPANPNTSAGCSLRSALRLASVDGHGTTPDLIKLQPGGYSQTGAQFVVADYTDLSATADLSCAPTSATSARINGGVAAAGTNILVLGNHDYLNSLDTAFGRANGIVINGSFNQLTCIVSEANTQNGILINPGASNNQIGGINPTATDYGYPIEIIVESNTLNGIVITGTNTVNNSVQGAGIGYVPGVGALANAGAGILIGGGASNNTIGGNTISQRNIIGDNAGGVILTEAATSGNKITGNYIGTDETGNIAESNGTFAVYIKAATNTQVGGDSANGFGNLIDASTVGVYIASSTGNNVQGNIIGPSAAFTGTIANSYGILLDGGATNNTIGGEEDGSAHLGNTISGNAYGIIVTQLANPGFPANNNIFGNRIGTNLTGNAALSNSVNGIYISNSSGNKIGGSGTGQGNLVSGNAYSGITLLGNVTNTIIQGNLIGVKGDLSGPLYNGTSTGTGTGGTYCKPNGGTDHQSEDCNGIFLSSIGVAPGPSGNQIGGNSGAGQGR